MKVVPVALALLLTCSLLTVAVPAVSVGGDADPPLVDAGLDQTVLEGETVLLDGGGSYAPDGEIESYQWIIVAPDGEAFTPECPSCERTEFLADQVGTYEVTLEVTDDNGLSGSDTLYVTVEGTEREEGPSIGVSGPADVTTGDFGEFQADTEAGDAPLDEVIWEVDGVEVRNSSVDGTEDTSRYERRFDEAGTVQVGATVIDEEGRTATDSVTVDVTSADSPQPPTVMLQGPDQVCVGQHAEFDAFATGGERIVSYRWTGVDDSFGSTGERQFDEAGSYTVGITVEDRAGNTASDAMTVDVSESLGVEIVGPDSVISGREGTFRANVIDGCGNEHGYDWRPHDGSATAGGEVYSRTFDEEVGETVVIEVTAENEYDDTATATHEVNVTDQEYEDGPVEAAPQLTGIAHHSLNDSEDWPRGTYEFVAEFEHGDNPGSTLTFTFDDGETQTVSAYEEKEDGRYWATVQRQFYSPGGGEESVIVDVTVEDQRGTIDTLRSDPLVVDTMNEMEADPNFTADRTSIYEGESVAFSVRSLLLEFDVEWGADERRSFSASTLPVGWTTTFNETGIYTVRVSGTSQYQAITDTIEITVYPESYEVYYYEYKTGQIVRFEGPEPPDSRDGWVRGDYTGEVEREFTGETIHLPLDQEPEGNWGNPEIVEVEVENTWTTVDTEAPGEEWEKIEAEVDSEYEYTGTESQWAEEPPEGDGWEPTDTRTRTVEPAEYEYKVQTQERETEWQLEHDGDYETKRCLQWDPSGPCLYYEYLVVTQEAQYQWQDSKPAGEWEDRRMVEPPEEVVETRWVRETYETIYYHEYEKTYTTTHQYRQWEKYERIFHYEWILDQREGEERYAMDDPTEREYYDEDAIEILERVEYSCLDGYEGPEPERCEP